eukprot:CAMPEP_0117673812 /NCGR_PEP_ID=MMETSP0804-20121206/14683_1 /TAXON_ID=1074897 /ORGANISM="Tetraselmis astigmatica, Strain CCMP880" /LENGTH=86 /DNA_ID=CAMNT_0005482597 /DNA_START=1169 /DNA_END=1430 /DNA_ORIENTATION=+
MSRQMVLASLSCSTTFPVAYIQCALACSDLCLACSRAVSGPNILAALFSDSLMCLSAMEAQAGQLRGRSTSQGTLQCGGGGPYIHA